jgi:hypothetical protein
MRRHACTSGRLTDLICRRRQIVIALEFTARPAAVRYCGVLGSAAFATLPVNTIIRKQWRGADCFD